MCGLVISLCFDKSLIVNESSACSNRSYGGTNFSRRLDKVTEVLMWEFAVQQFHYRAWRKSAVAAASVPAYRQTNKQIKSEAASMESGRAHSEPRAHS